MEFKRHLRFTGKASDRSIKRSIHMVCEHLSEVCNAASGPQMVYKTIAEVEFKRHLRFTGKAFRLIDKRSIHMVCEHLSEDLQGSQWASDGV